MRKLKIGIVILVVIGFPLMSWIYLSSGLKWRITAQEETVVKGAAGAFTLVSLKGEELSPEEMAGRFYIFTTLEDTLSSSTMRRVHEQFAVRSDYRTVCLHAEFDSTGIAPTPDATSPRRHEESRWLDVKCQSGCDALIQLLFADGATAAIVDDSLRVRGRYNLANAEDVKALIRHTAVVLPIEKREKLELKRHGNQ